MRLRLISGTVFTVQTEIFWSTSFLRPETKLLLKKSKKKNGRAGR